MLSHKNKKHLFVFLINDHHYRCLISAMICKLADQYVILPLCFKIDLSPGLPVKDKARGVLHTEKKVKAEGRAFFTANDGQPRWF